MPDPEHPDYHVPLDDLTGKHGYALARNEDGDEPIDPGAPVAYVADTLKERPNALTIEGVIQGVGDLAYNAAKEGGTPAWTMRAVAAAFIVPTVLGMLIWVWSRFS